MAGGVGGGRQAPQGECGRCFLPSLTVRTVAQRGAPAARIQSHLIGHGSKIHIKKIKKIPRGNAAGAVIYESAAQFGSGNYRVFLRHALLYVYVPQLLLLPLAWPSPFWPQRSTSHRSAVYQRTLLLMRRDSAPIPI